MVSSGIIVLFKKRYQEQTAMKNMRIEFSQERIIPAGGLSIIGVIHGKSEFVKRCNRMDVTQNRSQHQIKNGDVLLTYIGMLCMGKPAFDSVHEFDDNREFYQYALGITRTIPSEGTIRQRMDDIGSSLRSQILAENVSRLRMNGISPSKLPKGDTPVFKGNHPSVPPDHQRAPAVLSGFRE